MLDPTFRNHLKHGRENSKMISWKFQNEVIKCLATFVRSNIKAEMSDYFAVIADEVTDRFSNSEVLLLCLRYVTFHNEKPKIYIFTVYVKLPCTRMRRRKRNEQ